MKEFDRFSQCTCFDVAGISSANLYADLVLRGQKF